MKISHSASPRNRSSRSSRSPPTGIEMAGTAAGAIVASGAIVSASPARGGPEIRSAMDVIWHRVEVGPQRQIVSVRYLQAIYVGAARTHVRLEVCRNEDWNVNDIDGTHAGPAIGSA